MATRTGTRVAGLVAVGCERVFQHAGDLARVAGALQETRQRGDQARADRPGGVSASSACSGSAMPSLRFSSSRICSCSRSASSDSGGPAARRAWRPGPARRRGPAARCRRRAGTALRRACGARRPGSTRRPCRHCRLVQRNLADQQLVEQLPVERRIAAVAGGGAAAACAGRLGRGRGRGQQGRRGQQRGQRGAPAGWPRGLGHRGSRAVESHSHIMRPCPNFRGRGHPAGHCGTLAAVPACWRRGWASRCAGRSAGRREALVGGTVGEVARRGKYLWLPLHRRRRRAAAAATTAGLLLHLGMSGSLALLAAGPGAGAARSLRPRHRPRHAAPERPAALRRRGLVAVAARRRRPRRCCSGWAPSPSIPRSRRRPSTPRCSAAARRSRRCCWPATWWWAPATSTPARRCSRPASTPRCAPTASAARAPRGCWRRCATRWRGRWTSAARRCATSPTPTA